MTSCCSTVTKCAARPVAPFRRRRPRAHADAWADPDRPRPTPTPAPTPTPSARRSATSLGSTPERFGDPEIPEVGRNSGGYEAGYIVVFGYPSSNGNGVLVA